MSKYSHYLTLEAGGKGKLKEAMEGWQETSEKSGELREQGDERGGRPPSLVAAMIQGIFLWPIVTPLRWLSYPFVAAYRAYQERDWSVFRTLGKQQLVGTFGRLFHLIKDVIDTSTEASLTLGRLISYAPKIVMTGLSEFFQRTVRVFNRRAADVMIEAETQVAQKVGGVRGKISRAFTHLGNHWHEKAMRDHRNQQFKHRIAAMGHVATEMKGFSEAILAQTIKARKRKIVSEGQAKVMEWLAHSIQALSKIVQDLVVTADTERHALKSARGNLGDYLEAVEIYQDAMRKAIAQADTKIKETAGVILGAFEQLQTDGNGMDVRTIQAHVMDLIRRQTNKIEVFTMACQEDVAEKVTQDAINRKPLKRHRLRSVLLNMLGIQPSVDGKALGNSGFRERAQAFSKTMQLLYREERGCIEQLDKKLDQYRITLAEKIKVVQDDIIQSQDFSELTQGKLLQYAEEMGALVGTIGDAIHLLKEKSDADDEVLESQLSMVQQAYDRFTLKAKEVELSCQEDQKVILLAKMEKMQDKILGALTVHLKREDKEEVSLTPQNQLAVLQQETSTDLSDSEEQLLEQPVRSVIFGYNHALAKTSNDERLSTKEQTHSHSHKPR